MDHHHRSAAVVVGVDRYPEPEIDDLSGAVADARAMARLLVERYGFSPDRVITLYDDRATAARIESAFDWLVRTVAPRGAAVFFFAGHGAQRYDPAGDEVDDFDETFVPHDSGRGPRPDRDIPDDTLRVHLRRLAGEVGPEGSVTAIFDCCHSGTLGREVDGVRRAPPGRGPRGGGSSDRGPRLRRSGGASAYTLLAAARAGQLSYERATRPGGPKRGLFTTALIEALGASTADDSWRTIMARVSAAVRAKQPAQAPQVEGLGCDQRPFSSALPRSRWALAEPVADGLLVALGRLHGVKPGDVIELLPLSASEPRCRAQVADVGPLSSRCVHLHPPGPTGPLRALPPPEGASLWALAGDPAFGTDPFRLVFETDGLLDDDGAHRVVAGDVLTLRFDNSHGNNRLHLAIVEVDPDGDTRVLLPDPGGELQIPPFTAHDEPLEAELSPDRPGGQVSQLVLIACTEPFDPRPLESAGRARETPSVKDLPLALYRLVVRIAPPVDRS